MQFIKKARKSLVDIIASILISKIPYTSSTANAQIDIKTAESINGYINVVIVAAHTFVNYSL
jgi:hypothetical protein